MIKPDEKQVEKLILGAPIGKYIGDVGAKTMSERACCEVTLKENEFLFRQGDLTTSFFIISSGRLARVNEKDKDKKPHILHVLEPGDLVGELSFVDGTPHASSVMALGEATAVRFKAEDIRPLITEHPQLMFDFMRAVIRRVHQTATAIGKQQMALADYISTGGKGRT